MAASSPGSRPSAGCRPRPDAVAEAARPLEGVVVLERAGRLAVAASGFLLAQLGARVVRLAPPEERFPEPEARLRTGGKESFPYTPEAFAQWRKRANVVLASGTDVLEAEAGQVLVRLSARGQGQPDLPEDASDALIQALGGLMAVSGERGGRPEYAPVPIAELSSAVIATGAVCASLFQGEGRVIDLSLLEVMADQLRTHISLVQKGRTDGFRIGCALPVCCPWNVYRGKDGWVLICSASDAQWRALLGVMGRDDLAEDPRYKSTDARKDRMAEVDELVQAWIEERPVAEAVAAIEKIGVPVGPALGPLDVPKDPVLRDLDTVKSPGAMRIVPSGTAGAESAKPKGEFPLSGVRVVELTVYAAGPLGGFVLSSLGADVYKVEPPTGEECRKWLPKFGATSGYFVNYNAGKKSLALDLRDAGARERLRELIAGADVLLHNLRPGAIERLGFGAEDVAKLNPSLVYCSISGFGRQGPKLAALDTVIQGRAGLTGLVGASGVPVRVGYSIADQLAGHFAATTIGAALLERRRTGRGQVVDIAMADAIAWLTHLAWGTCNALPPTTQLQASDGWVVAAAADFSSPNTPTKRELVQELSRRGIAAAPVLEVDEVLSQPALQARGALRRVRADEEDVDLFRAPLGMPVFVPGRVAALGEHNAMVERVPA